MASNRRGAGGTDREPIGPDGWPLMANTVQFARDPFGFFERCVTYGDVVPYTVAGRTFYMVTHPEDIKRMLSTEHRTLDLSAQVGWNYS